MNQAEDITMDKMSIETILQAELAHADGVIETMGPIMHHLLVNDDHSLFSDEIVARVRGMLEGIARQLLIAQAEAAGEADPREYADEEGPSLFELLLHQPVLVGHAHALALEWQLTQRLQARNAIDPVLSPLVQQLIASGDSQVAEAGMMALAAEARFVQSQRRMELPLGELPGDLFHAAMLVARSHAGAENDETAAQAEAKLRAAFDEGNNRLGLINRLIQGMGRQANKALSIDHAGVAFFLSALAMASGLDRDLAIVATNDRQLARLALALRTAGLSAEMVEQQFIYIHPGITLPEGFDQLRIDRAASLLANSNLASVG